MNIKTLTVGERVVRLDEPLEACDAIAAFRVGRNMIKLLAPGAGAIVLHQWNVAQLQFGLPTAYSRIFNAVYNARNGLEPQTVTVVEMPMIEPTMRFKFSQGGKTKLKNWIAREWEQERLKRILRALCAGKKAGLVDPHGAYLRLALQPILFLSVELGMHETTAFDELIGFTERKLDIARRAALPPARMVWVTEARAP